MHADSTRPCHPLVNRAAPLQLTMIPGALKPPGPGKLNGPTSKALNNLCFTVGNIAPLWLSAFPPVFTARPIVTAYFFNYLRPPSIEIDSNMQRKEIIASDFKSEVSHIDLEKLQRKTFPTGLSIA